MRYKFKFEAILASDTFTCLPSQRFGFTIIIIIILLLLLLMFLFLFLLFGELMSQVFIQQNAS